MTQYNQNSLIILKENLLECFLSWWRRTRLCRFEIVRGRNQLRAWVREQSTRRGHTLDPVTLPEDHPSVQYCWPVIILRIYSKFTVYLLCIDIPGSCSLYDDVIWLDSSWNEADASFVVIFRHGFGYDAAITRAFILRDLSNMGDVIKWIKGSM